MAHQIKFRRDTASNFTSNNPTLAAGEPGYETDTGKVKIGDGTTAWTSLAYLVGASGSVTSVGSGGGLSGGPITISGSLAVGAGTGITVNPDNVAVDMSVFSTSDLSEGTNLYFTTDRANSAIEAHTGNIANLTGNITTTGNVTTSNLYVNGPQYSAGDITLENWPESDYEIKGDIDGAVRFTVQAGEDLSKGNVVYISGAAGNNTIVSKADASDPAKMAAFGLVLEDITSGGSGQAVSFGNLYGSGGAPLDTSGYTLGDTLYVSTTPGVLANVPPTGEGTLVQNIGRVVRVQSSNGIIKVGGAGRTNATPNLNDGNVFIGNASNQAVSAILDTSIVPENTNEYFTTARARAAISATGDISYDSGTGVISFTETPAPVDSVNGATGVVVLDTDDISEGSTNKYLSATNVLATDMTLKQFSETVNAVGNSSGSVTIDHNLGSIHTMTLTGAITQLAFSNLAAGESGILVLTQDVTGSHTFASTNMIFAGGAPTLTTAGGSIDVISYVSDGTSVLASFSGDYKA